MSKGKTYEELSAGEKASFSKTVSESDVYMYAGITGDFNPAHVDEEYSRKTKFGTRVAHGGLTFGLIAPVLGMKLPGPGTIAVEFNLRFLAPVKFGDTITATAEVAEKLENGRVRMKLSWTNQRGETVADGTGIVLPPK